MAKKRVPISQLGSISGATLGGADLIPVVHNDKTYNISVHELGIGLGVGQIPDNILLSNGLISLDAGYTPGAPQQIATKLYVDDTVPDNLLLSDGSVPMDIGYVPVGTLDIATKAYVDSNSATGVLLSDGSVPLDDGYMPVGNMDIAVYSNISMSPVNGKPLPLSRTITAASSIHANLEYSSYKQKIVGLTTDNFFILVDPFTGAVDLTVSNTVGAYIQITPSTYGNIVAVGNSADEVVLLDIDNSFAEIRRFPVNAAYNYIASGPVINSHSVYVYIGGDTNGTQVEQYLHDGTYVKTFVLPYIVGNYVAYGMQVSETKIYLLRYQATGTYQVSIFDLATEALIETHQFFTFTGLSIFGSFRDFFFQVSADESTFYIGAEEGGGTLLHMYSATVGDTNSKIWQQSVNDALTNFDTESNGFFYANMPCVVDDSVLGLYGVYFKSSLIGTGYVPLSIEYATSIRVKNLQYNNYTLGDGALDLSFYIIGDDDGATGNYTFAQGFHTRAVNDYSSGFGMYNVGTSTTTLLEVGMGTADLSRANALEVHNDGDVQAPNATLANAKSLTTRDYVLGTKTYTAPQRTSISAEDNAIDFTGNNNFSLTATAANITAVNVSSCVGQSGVIVIASSENITGWSTEFIFKNGAPIGLIGTEIFAYFVDTPTTIRIGRVQ